MDLELLRGGVWPEDYIKKYGDWKYVIKMLRNGHPYILQSEALRNLIADKLDGIAINKQGGKYDSVEKERLDEMVAYIVCGAVIDGLPLYASEGNLKKETAFDRVKKWAKSDAKNDPVFKGMNIKLAAKASIEAALTSGLRRGYSSVRRYLEYQFIAKAFESEDSFYRGHVFTNADALLKELLDSKLKKYLPAEEKQIKKLSKN